MTASDLIREIERSDPADAPALLAAIASLLAQHRLAAEVSTPEPADDTNLTIEEAAALLRKSTKWVYRRMKNGGLPFVRKIGPRSYVVSKQKLESWLARRPC